MGKEKSTTSRSSDNDVQSSRSGERVTVEKKVEKVQKPMKPKTVTVFFRQNRKFDLHVARQVVEFGPHESKEIPVEWLDDPGFKQAAKYFTVKGV